MSKKKIHVMWDRVKSTPPSEKDVERRKMNDNTLQSERFRKACNDANVSTTRRQARKFNLGKGLAFKNRSSHE
jgi:hypothetical protein